MWSKYLVFLCSIGLALAGCVTQKNMRELDADQFLELYLHAGTVGDYWEYEGKSHGKHWLYHYKMERQSVPIVVEKAYISEDMMPAGFPQVGQPAREAGSLDGVQGVLKSLGTPEHKGTGK